MLYFVIFFSYTKGDPNMDTEAGWLKTKGADPQKNPQNPQSKRNP